MKTTGPLKRNDPFFNFIQGRRLLKSRRMRASVCAISEMASRLRLFDGEDLVGRDVCESLNRAAGPGDLDFLDDRVRAKAKVNTGVAGARVADRRCRFVPLRTVVRSRYFDLRAQTHVVTAGADEAQKNPMLTRRADIAEELDGLVETRDDSIDAAGVKDVTKGRASMCTGDLEAGASTGTDVLKLPVSEIAEDGVGLRVGLCRNRLLNVIHHIGASNKQIFPTIIVEVVNAVAPPCHAIGERSEAARIIGIYKSAAALIDIKREAFVLDRVMPDVRQAIVVDVTEIRAHTGKSVTIGRVSNAGGDRNLFELLSANVAEEEIGHGVVSDEGIEKSVAVDIGEAHSHAFAEKGVDPGLVRDIRERSVAIIPMKRIVQRRVQVGMAVGTKPLFERAVGVFVDLPMAVVDYKEIEQPVVVVVEPTRADRPHLLIVGVRPSDTGSGSDVRECAVAVVAKELVAGDVGDEDVGVAVVVEVSNGDAHPVARSSDSRFFCDVGECAVVVVAEESIPVGGRSFFERRDLGSVDGIDVEEPVIVVVEQRNAGNHGFGLVLVGRGAIAGNKVETGLLGNLVEANAGKRRRCARLREKRREAARGYRRCSDKTENLEEASALKTRNTISGHFHERGCRMTANPHYCYSARARKNRDTGKENAI
jgi:hypothetical protein